MRGDLDLLRSQYLPSLSETIELPHRDYPYRAYTDRATLGQAMVQMMLDLNYSNFKNEVMDKQGLAREQLYHEVWNVMYNAEKKLEDKEKRNASRPVYSSGAFDEFWEHYQGRDVSAKGSKPVPENLLGDDTDLGVPAFEPRSSRRSVTRNVVARRPSKPTKPTKRR